MKAENSTKIQFDSLSANEAFARAAVACFAAQLDPTLDELGDIKTAVSEAVTNAIVHAYPQEIGRIALRASIFDGNLLEITVRDWGCGIADVEKAREPLYTTGGEERSGMGFTIMESFMDSLKVRSVAGRGTTVETLISDMKGDHASLDTVIAAHPEVLNHNVETVKELQTAVRPQARYERSLGVLRYCKEQDPTLLTKTGFMVGLGETEEQISRLMDDILETGCDILTIGQYLQPSPQHYPLARYATPEDFARWKELAISKGFRHVASAPLARSSYKAWEALEDVHDLY